MSSNEKNTDLRYHLVWCTKYRRKVLTGDFADRLRELLFDAVENIGGEVFELSIEPDHVHLFGKFPHTLSVDQIMFRIKGYSSHFLRKEFPWIKSRLPCLWTRSYYAGSVGEISSTVVEKYIQNQKNYKKGGSHSSIG